MKYDDDLSDEAVDLMKGLLERDPTKRLGAGGAEEIKCHEFFRGVDWDDVLDMKVDMPRPYLMKSVKEMEMEAKRHPRVTPTG